MSKRETARKPKNMARAAERGCEVTGAGGSAFMEGSAFVEGSMRRRSWIRLPGPYRSKVPKRRISVKKIKSEIPFLHPPVAIS